MFNPQRHSVNIKFLNSISFNYFTRLWLFLAKFSQFTSIDFILLIKNFFSMLIINPDLLLKDNKLNFVYKRHFAYDRYLAKHLICNIFKYSHYFIFIFETLLFICFIVYHKLFMKLFYRLINYSCVQNMAKTCFLVFFFFFLS